ncbi:ABC transporter permease [Paenibacillus filicis]|uniref:ABC transporter permease n=1 Tax=Paenibacillus filicis TaxID=669464 RepID=A0ABU9DJV8_9BACL
MLNLMRLEMSKHRMGSYVIGAVIANLVIALLVVLIGAVEGEHAYRGWEDAFSAIDAFSKSTFIVFGGVLLSRLVIDEYRNKTISLLFTYPVGRRKLLTAKLLLVGLWTFFSILFTDLWVTCIFLVMNTQLDMLADSLTQELLTGQMIQFLLQAAGAAGMSLIPLYFGMKRKSAGATIVSSVLIVLVVCSNSGGFSLSSIIAIPLSLAAIGVLIAYLSIRNVYRQDILE